MTSSAEHLTADKIVDKIKKCGVTHIVWLPDGVASFMYQSMMAQKDLTLVQVCREGEALPIAAGLVLGGKKPLVLHQSTGIFESGDSIRLVASELRLPVLMLIGYRSWKPSPPVTDSAAIFIEPILKAWGIKYYLLRSDDDIDIISAADMEAQKTSKPVVILIARELQF